MASTVPSIEEITTEPLEPINLIINWTGSALPTSGTRPVFDHLQAWKALNPTANVHIIVNSACLGEAERDKLLAQKTILEAQGINFIDTSNSFETLNFDPRLEAHYHEAMSKAEGSLAHVFSSDIIRVAALKKFASEKVLYLDADKLPQALPKKVMPHPIGLHYFPDKNTLNSDFFYLDLAQKEAVEFTERATQRFLNVFHAMKNYIHGLPTTYEEEALIEKDMIDEHLRLQNETSIFAIERYGTVKPFIKPIVLSLTCPSIFYHVANAMTDYDLAKLDIRHISSELCFEESHINKSTWLPEVKDSLEVDITLDECIFRALDVGNFNGLINKLKQNKHIPIDTPFYSINSYSNHEKITARVLCQRNFDETGDPLWIEIIKQLSTPEPLPTVSAALDPEHKGSDGDSDISSLVSSAKSLPFFTGSNYHEPLIELLRIQQELIKKEQVAIEEIYQRISNAMVPIEGDPLLMELNYLQLQYRHAPLLQDMQTLHQKLNQLFAKYPELSTSDGPKP